MLGPPIRYPLQITMAIRLFSDGRVLRPVRMVVMPIMHASISLANVMLVVLSMSLVLMLVYGQAPSVRNVRNVRTVCILRSVSDIDRHDASGPHIPCSPTAVCHTLPPPLPPCAQLP